MNNPGGAYSCTDEGATDVELGPGDPPNEPLLQSYLDLGQDGQYTGSLYKQVTLTIARKCPGGPPGSFAGDVTMRLSIAGSLDAGGRMQGEMVPDVSPGQTMTGSWDFAPR